PCRRVFQSHYGKDADLWRHWRAGYLLMAGLPRGCLSLPLAPESIIAHEACSYFVRLLDSWFCLDPDRLLLLGYALGIPLRYVPFPRMDYRHYPGQNIQNPAIHRLE